MTEEDKITREPMFTTEPFTGGFARYRVTARVRMVGMEHEMEVAAVMKEGMTVAPLMERYEDGTWCLKLVDPADSTTCYAATIQAPPPKLEDLEIDPDGLAYDSWGEDA